VFGSVLMRGGEGRGGEQNPSYTHFLLPPILEGFGGGGGEANYIITIIIIMTYLSSYLF
jgi:hypothetical protein